VSQILIPKTRSTFIAVRNETLSVAAMSVSNEDCSSFAIRGRDTAQLHPARLSRSAALLIVENDLPDSFIDLKLCAHFLDLRCRLRACSGTPGPSCRYTLSAAEWGVPIRFGAIPGVRHRLLVITIVAAVSALNALAQTDEIQVYDAEIAAPGKFNLMLHNNFTPDGRDTPAFHGAIIAEKSLNGVPEWAYGVTDWFEQGLYLPLYSISKNRGATVNGFKLRELFVAPHAADRTVFYGVNFEFSYNAKYWDASRFTSEIRPILGAHLHQFDVIVNPILDSAYNGFKNLDFAPATRVAYNFSPNIALAIEEYADLGPLKRFNSVSNQSHQLYGVFDHNTKALNVEFGVGFGLTRASDNVTLKLMLSRDLK
jgi:hypothetical protein